MRVHVLAPFSILPADTGGKIRVAELVLGASSPEVSITVLSPITPGNRQGVALNENVTIKVVPYPFFMPYFLTGRPFSYNVLMSLHPGFRLLIKRSIEQCDVVQFEGVSFASLIDHIPKGKKVIYDAHNVEHDYESGGYRTAWIRHAAVRRVARLEAKLARRADCILTCSEEDSQRLCSLYRVPQTKCTVIPNGIHLPVAPHDQSDRVTLALFEQCRHFSHRVIFSGSNVAHNRESVAFILNTLAPQLQQQCAFIIQGQCGRAFRKRGATNVFFDHRPGRVAAYAAFCTAALHPVIHGAGTSLKVLDYLANGLPLISTPFGMRGYADLKALVHLTERSGFCEAILSEAQRPAADSLALKPYAWAHVSTLLNSLYRRME